MGRSSEIKQLDDYYCGDRNNLIILYGRSNIGKTKLLLEFMKEKPCFYYVAREASEREQLLQIQAEVIDQSNCKLDKLDYFHILENAVLSNKPAYDENIKTIVVIEEFQHIIKNSKEFVTALTSIMSNKERYGRIMIILGSSSVNWVENDMVSSLGITARNISAFLKLKEFTFVDFVDRFPTFSVEQCININGILGGVPGYLMEWCEANSIEQNIKELILHPSGKLHCEAEHFLKTELRELSLYNTILAALAEGNLKLNDIYDRTEFNRAKISVYIKNLMQLDIVEKIFSFETDGKENTQKGLYRIKDNYINFWYRYVFPNLSMLERQQVDIVYENKVKLDLKNYMKEYFTRTCTECLKLMNQYRRLPFVYERWGSWFGKSGTIDIIAEDSKGNLLVGSCAWLDQAMDMTEYNHLLELVEQAQVTPNNFYLFAKNGFSKELEELAVANKSIQLIPLEEL